MSDLKSLNWSPYRVHLRLGKRYRVVSNATRLGFVPMYLSVEIDALGDNTSLIGHMDHILVCSPFHTRTIEPSTSNRTGK